MHPVLETVHACNINVINNSIYRKYTERLIALKCWWAFYIHNWCFKTCFSFWIVMYMLSTVLCYSFIDMRTASDLLNIRLYLSVKVLVRFFEDQQLTHVKVTDRHKLVCVAVPVGRVEPVVLVFAVCRSKFTKFKYACAWVIAVCNIVFCLTISFLCPSKSRIYECWRFEVVKFLQARAQICDGILYI